MKTQLPAPDAWQEIISTNLIYSYGAEHLPGLPRSS